MGVGALWIRRAGHWLMVGHLPDGRLVPLGAAISLEAVRRLCISQGWGFVGDYGLAAGR